MYTPFILDSVATKGELLQQLLVDFSLEWGVFTFRIFKQGKWQHVTIDDRLPAKKETRRCLFAIGVDTENEAGMSLCNNFYVYEY